MENNNWNEFIGKNTKNLTKYSESSQTSIFLRYFYQK